MPICTSVRDANYTVALWKSRESQSRVGNPYTLQGVPLPLALRIYEDHDVGTIACR